MFSIGDYIVKAGEGVCRIDCEIMMKGPGGSDEKPYYLLVPISDDRIKVYLPVSEDYQEIRPVMSRSRAEEILNEFSGIESAVVENEKQRETVYKEAIRSCEPEKIISVIKHLKYRCTERKAQGKKNTAVDDRYFAMAEKALFSELGFVLDKTDEEVKEILESQV